MIEVIKSFALMLAAVVLMLGGTVKPDPMANFADTQWVDENDWVYSFNEDASIFACYETLFFYGRMTTGEYRQASITQNGELIYPLNDRTCTFIMDGNDLLLQHYTGTELVYSERFTRYGPDAGTD